MRVTSCLREVRFLAGWLLVLAIFLAPADAGAQRARKTYYVVKLYPEGIEGIVVSLGEASGAVPGQKVRIYRAVEVRHPVSGQKMSDRFPLGDVELIEVGRTLSVCEDLPEIEESEAGTVPVLKGTGGTAEVAKPEKKSRVKVGDQVELVGTPRVVEMVGEAATSDKKLPWAAAKPVPVAMAECPEADCPACPPTSSAMDDATVAAVAAWKRTLGHPIGVRMEIWKKFLQAHPDSPYASNVKSEISSLELQQAESRRLAKEAMAAATLKPPPKPGEEPLRFKHLPAKKLFTGQPLHVAVAASRLQPIRAADVYYRALETPTYKKKPMQRDGDAYLRAELGAKELSPPGVEYFIEAVDQKGDTYKVSGTQKIPLKVAVETPPGQILVERRNRSKVSLLYEYVNFRAGEGREGPTEDNFQRFEADFLYRIMTILYSIRVGCGVYTGQGGKIDVPDAKTVGFNYGYTELEFRFHEYFSMMGRVILGLNRPPGQEAAGLAGGFEGKIRIGKEMGTNLVMGAAILEDIGSLGLIELTWDVVRYFPMTGRVEVTTQPVQEDIGVRIMYQIGLSALDWFHPTLNVGVALRRIDHYGVSLGVGTVFQW